MKLPIGITSRIRMLSILALYAISAQAQTTEDELVQWTTQSAQAVAAGKVSELDHYRELHRRLAAMPSSYRYKAENLRIVGQRIDILEAAEAGTITDSKARRMIVEQQAEWENGSQRAAEAEADAQRQSAAADRARRENLAAQQEAQRRATALQILQNSMVAPQPAMQPYQIPIRPTTNCTSTRVGNQVQTVCR